MVIKHRHIGAKVVLALAMTLGACTSADFGGSSSGMRGTADKSKTSNGPGDQTKDPNGNPPSSDATKPNPSATNGPNLNTQPGNVFTTPSSNAVTIPGTQNVNIGTDDVTDNTADLVIDPGVADQQAASTVKRPLSVYFAIDYTASMNDNIDTITQNVANFAANLTASNFNVKLGALAFADLPGHDSDNSSNTQTLYSPLSSDPSVLKNFVQNLDTVTGGHESEAALDGTIQALNRVTTEDTDPTSTKAVITITDHAGYASDGDSSNCPLTATVAAFNNLPAAQHQHVKFFYSVDSKTDDNCQGSGGTAPVQMSQLLSQILTDIPQDQRGGSLPYPFSQASLSTFASLINQLVPASDLVCLSQSATVSHNGTQTFSWQASSLASVYAAYTSGQKLTIKSFIPKDQIQTYTTGQNQVTVQRCCVASSDATAGNFGTCASTKTQNATFSLHVK